MVDLVSYSDSLFDGTKKVNDSIKQSNAAFTSAERAAVISEAAEILAKSVQEQVNQVVIEGDSSVEAAQARVDAKGQSHPTLKSRIDNFEVSATQQLAQKADQSFVDSQLSAIVSGAPKGTYTDLNALRTAYPSGAEGVFLVLENGHWYYWDATTISWADGGVYLSNSIEEYLVSENESWVI